MSAPNEPAGNGGNTTPADRANSASVRLRSIAEETIRLLTTDLPGPDLIDLNRDFEDRAEYADAVTENSLRREAFEDRIERETISHAIGAVASATTGIIEGLLAIADAVKTADQSEQAREAVRRGDRIVGGEAIVAALVHGARTSLDDAGVLAPNSPQHGDALARAVDSLTSAVGRIAGVEQYLPDVARTGGVGQYLPGREVLDDGVREVTKLRAMADEAETVAAKLITMAPGEGFDENGLSVERASDGEDGAPQWEVRIADPNPRAGTWHDRTIEQAVSLILEARR